VTELISEMMSLWVQYIWQDFYSLAPGLPTSDHYSIKTILAIIIARNPMPLTPFVTGLF